MFAIRSAGRAILQPFSMLLNGVDNVLEIKTYDSASSISIQACQQNVETLAVSSPGLALSRCYPAGEASAPAGRCGSCAASERSLAQRSSRCPEPSFSSLVPTATKPKHNQTRTPQHARQGTAHAQQTHAALVQSSPKEGEYTRPLHYSVCSW